ATGPRYHAGPPRCRTAGAFESGARHRLCSGPPEIALPDVPPPRPLRRRLGAHAARQLRAVALPAVLSARGRDGPGGWPPELRAPGEPAGPGNPPDPERGAAAHLGRRGASP